MISYIYIFLIYNEPEKKKKRETHFDNRGEKENSKFEQKIFP
jgi:hypothetical protein